MRAHRTPVTDVEVRAIIAAYQDGSTINDVATDFRRAWTTVRKILADAGVDLRRTATVGPRPPAPTTESDPVRRTDWQDRAACLGQWELMEPADQTARAARRALELCRACPVLKPCRRAILERDELQDRSDMVQGGLTRRQRRAVRKKREAAAA